MAIIVEMPRLTDTMEEGVLVAWRKQEGDTVSIDDVLGEVETDKATMEELTAYDKGVLLKHLIRPGDSVPPGSPVAILGKAGEDISALLGKLGAAGAGNGREAAIAEVPAQVNAATEAALPAPPAPVVAAISGASTAPAIARDPSAPVLASPLARRLAREQGIDIGAVSGSGPKGRIVARDLSGPSTGTAVSRPAPPSTRAPAGVPAVGTATSTAPAAKSDAPSAPALRAIDLPEPQVADGKVVPLSMMRKTIARRLTDSKSGIPHYYVTIAFDADPLTHFRERANADAGEKGTKISVNDLLIKACARALKTVPAVNASWSDKGIVMHQRVDIGIAVAVDEGLITPVVRSADKKTLGEIAAEVHDLVTRARARRLKPDEYRHGTFSISNLGMFGVSHFAAVINPPEAAILAVGAVQLLPVVRGDTVVPGHVLKVTMSCDHRVVDGAVAAHFLATLRDFVEHPMRLVV